MFDFFGISIFSQWRYLTFINDEFERFFYKTSVDFEFTFFHLDIPRPSRHFHTIRDV